MESDLVEEIDVNGEAIDMEYWFFHWKSLMPAEPQSDDDSGDSHSGGESEEKTQVIKKGRRRATKPFTQYVQNILRLPEKRLDGFVFPKSKVASPFLHFAVFRSSVPCIIKKRPNVSASSLKPLTANSKDCNNQVFVVFPGDRVFEVIRGRYYCRKITDSFTSRLNPTDEYVMTKDKTKQVNEWTKILKLLMYLPQDPPAPLV